MNTTQHCESESLAAQQSLLNEHDVAEILNVSVASVRRWQLFDRGPPFLKIGASVRYRPEALSEWVETRPTGGTNSGRAEPRP
jgi:predicted DNA-binding transcriptional regulator AlpA